jgi:hypothetical protein
MKKLLFLNILLVLPGLAFGMFGTAGHVQFRKPQTPKIQAKPVTPAKKPSISPQKVFTQTIVPEEKKLLFERWLQPSKAFKFKPVTVEPYKAPYIKAEVSPIVEEEISEKRLSQREMAELIRRQAEKQAIIPAPAAKKEYPAIEYPMYKEPLLIGPEIAEEELQLIPSQPRELVALPEVERPEYQERALTLQEIERRKIELILNNFSAIVQHVLGQLPYEESKELIPLSSQQSIARIASDLSRLKGIKQPQVVWVLEQLIIDIAKLSGYSRTEDTVKLPDDDVLQSLLSKAIIQLDSFAKQIEEAKERSKVEEQRYPALHEPVHRIEEIALPAPQIPEIPITRELALPESEPIIRAIEPYKEPETLPEIKKEGVPQIEKPIEIGKELALPKPEEKNAQERAKKELIKEVGALKEIAAEALAETAPGLRPESLKKEQAMVSGGEIPPTGKRPRTGELFEGDENLPKKLKKNETEKEIKGQVAKQELDKKIGPSLEPKSTQEIEAAKKLEPIEVKSSIAKPEEIQFGKALFPAKEKGSITGITERIKPSLVTTGKLTPPLFEQEMASPLFESRYEIPRGKNIEYGKGQMPAVGTAYPAISQGGYEPGKAKPIGAYTLPEEAVKTGEELQEQKPFAYEPLRTHETIPSTPSGTSYGLEGAGPETVSGEVMKAPSKILEKEEKKEIISQLPITGFIVLFVILAIIGSYIAWREYQKRRKPF